MISTTLIHRILKRPFLILNMLLAYAVISHEAFSQPQDAAMVIMGSGSSFQGGGGEAMGMRIHPTTNTHQSEMSIAVSPWNNKKVLASANTSNYPVSVIYGTGYYISTDGGTNWTGNDVPPTGNNRGDPAVVIDTLGYFYIGSIAPNYGQGIMKSTNGGSTWQYIQVADPQVPNNANNILDKNHLAVDNSTISSYRGNLYSGWSDFGFADRRITVARSTDRGQTWVSQQAISVGLADNMGHQGVNLQVGPDGKVYACWAVRDRVSPFTERGIGFNVSTDGGQTWGTPQYAINNILGMRQSPYPVLGIRTNSFPTMGIDLQNGVMYIAWVNIGVPGTNVGDPDVYLIRSTNGGTNWSTPVRVNSDLTGNGAIQFHCWLSIDPLAARHVYVAFYDNRDNIGTNLCKFYVAFSADSGKTFSNFAVSDTFRVGPIPGFQGNYNGEYPGIAARASRFYPTWHSQVPGPNAQAWVSPGVHANFTVKNTIVRKDTAYYVATNSITASSNFTINSSAYVTFQVGNSTGNVILKDGFLATQGSEFRAYIGGQVPKRSNVGEPAIAIETKGNPTTYYSLLQNYPNPFNPETNIPYQMTQNGFATLRVYDLLGREIMTLVDGYQTAGKYVVTFNASDLPSGVYIYRLTANDFTSKKRMLLMK